MGRAFMLRMDKKGRITVPKFLRELWGVDPNSEYELRGTVTSLKKKVKEKNKKNR